MISIPFELKMFRGGQMTIEVVSAEALPLCMDDKGSENASMSKLHAFVEVKVRIFHSYNLLMITQGGRKKCDKDKSAGK